MSAVTTSVTVDTGDLFYRQSEAGVIYSDAYSDAAPVYLRCNTPSVTAVPAVRQVTRKTLRICGAYGITKAGNTRLSPSRRLRSVADKIPKHSAHAALAV